MEITFAHVTLAALGLAALGGAYWLGTRARAATAHTDDAAPSLTAPPPAPEASAMPSKPKRPTIDPGPLNPAAGTRATAPAAAAHAPPSARIVDAKSWGYQLQKLDIERAAASPFDVLVIDTTRDGSAATTLTPADLKRLKRKPDGSTRIVLAYLSIGEAESYRPYWQHAWEKTKPGWLLGENPEWEENYAVCFWDPEWQRLMCGSRDAALDRVLAVGFDGVYLDKCDVYEDLREHFRQVAKTRPRIEADMVEFVRRLSAYAKGKVPGFLVVMQNAEDLVHQKGLLDAIDGIAKEELIYGVDKPEKRNSADDIAESTRCLEAAKRAGKPVFCVEYLNAEAKITDARTEIEKRGFVLTISPKNRELDRLVY